MFQFVFVYVIGMFEFVLDYNSKQTLYCLVCITPNC